MSEIIVKTQTTPATPSSGQATIWADSNSYLNITGSSGSTFQLAVSGTTTVTSEPSADLKASGLITTLTAGVTMAFGDVGCIASNGRVNLSKADVIANANAVVMSIGSVSASATGNYLMVGIARNDAWNWTAGGLIYLSTTGTTGNTLTQTAPSGTNNVIQILGVATHADRVLFNPSLVQVVHA